MRVCPCAGLRRALPVGAPFSPDALWDLCLAPLALYATWWLLYGAWLLLVGCTLPGDGPGQWGRSSFADAQPTIQKTMGVKSLRGQVGWRVPAREHLPAGMHASAHLTQTSPLPPARRRRRCATSSATH